MERLWRGEADEPAEQRESAPPADDGTDFWDDILAGEAAAIEAGDQPFTFSELGEPEPTDEPEKPFRGGRFRELPTEPGWDRHHVIADESLQEAGMNPDEGPAVQMEREDHWKTASWGPWARAEAFRAEQTKLLLAGRSAEALAMGILDLQVKFGAKYHQAIEEAIDATER